MSIKRQETQAAHVGPRILRPGRLLAALWAAIAVQLLGRLIDLRWHLTHDEFEGAAQQVEAHWLIWLGTAAIVLIAAISLRRASVEALRPGLMITLAAGALYGAVALWHFIEHASGADPEIAHYLLAFAGIAMVLGAVVATWRARRLA